MIITYTPNGQEPQRFEFDGDDVRAKDAEQIEEKSGVPWQSFSLAVLQGSIRPRRVLLWYLLRQKHGTLRLDDVDFTSKELKVEFTVKEYKEFRETVVRNSGRIPDSKRDDVLALVDAEIAKAEAEEAESAQGKAHSEISDASTA
ncbi:hypothetical protein NQK81_13280 [Amycolatopsis roodepoortensis]|uniref:hypothetical protein n=1 Tax=Amycolatopsis roodepoortensis TaxID=700274 RepID=UPI00214C4D6B|nr:hypothetical protein [Amycolatopsis roodepoortensis]UUV34377.1 hypothetical protein NQK81_13280 [Amycolatopsis roodepoortensis]